MTFKTPPFIDNDTSAANRVLAAWLNDLNVLAYTVFQAAQDVASARTALGLGTGDSPVFAGLTVGGSTGLTAADIGSTVAAYNANTAFLNVVQSWTVAQRGTPAVLTSTGNSIAVNLALANNFTYATLEDSTLAAPSNAVVGQAGVIVITQGSAAKTLAYNSFWKWPGGTAGTLTATIGAVDVISYYIESASRATCNMLNDVK